MTDISFKIAKRGEGKTKWLLNIANQYEASGRPVYMYTQDFSRYRKFCEKYLTEYNSVCRVERFFDNDLSGNEVILIDDLLSIDCSLADISYIQRNCYKMYVTVEGSTDCDIPPSDGWEQLTIFNCIHEEA